MRKYRLIRLLCLVFFGISVATVGFCQEVLTCKGVLIDSLTTKPLTDVMIYLGNDSVGIQNNKDGSFLLSVKEGETIRFRKKGYRWLNIKIPTDNPTTRYEMVPSTRSYLHGQVDEIIINGKILPKDEWDDVNGDYISDVSISVNDNKVTLIAKTKK